MDCHPDQVACSSVAKAEDGVQEGLVSLRVRVKKIQHPVSSIFGPVHSRR